MRDPERKWVWLCSWNETESDNR